MNELFTATSPQAWAPLALRIAPKDLSGFAGQEHLVGPDGPLRKVFEHPEPLNAIFFGPPGCGKTALARLIGGSQQLKTVELSCVEHGIPKIREVITQAGVSRSNTGKPTLLVLDEIHHLNRTQQDILLPYMESGVIAMIGMTTENPFFYIHKAVLSRALVFEFKSLEPEALASLLEKALLELAGEDKILRLTQEAKISLCRFCNGDARKLINALEFLALQAHKTEGSFDATDLKRLLGSRQVAYDKKADSHYDMASAFIKSMRGSDPDAAIYWMTKMLEGGEDPRFVARRILILASEDVGNADPLALVVAQSAFHATEVLGMPECAITLAQAAVFVACAPKSNASYMALNAARKEIADGPARHVPDHLKDASQDAVLGHGKGYKYAHDHPSHFVEQEYMPKHKIFYQPTDLGHEAKIRARLEQLWKRKYS